MSQVKQDLETAYEILEQRGWCQKVATSSDPVDCPVCLQAALAVATMGDAALWSITTPDGEHWDVDGTKLRSVTALEVERHVAAIRVLGAVIAAAEPAFYRQCNDIINVVWLWNDRQGRTVDQVKYLLRTAIERCGGDG